MPEFFDASLEAPAGSRSLVAPELLAGLEAFPALDLSDEFIAMLRKAEAIGVTESRMATPELTEAQKSVICEERYVPGMDGEPNVRLLIYRPSTEAATPRPALLHMHGGGFVLGKPEINDASSRDWVVELDCIVASVDYRLAPEARFPAALHDCYGALRWLHTEAAQLGIDPDRIAIGGESAGGGHAAALALLARDRGEVPILFQLLDSPMLDDRTGSSHAPHPYCGEFAWTPKQNHFGWQALLGMEPGGPDVPAEAAPARAVDLSGLPPTFIAVGALDLFLEEDLEYARRLIRAGVSTEFHVIPGAFHGFGIAGKDAPQVQLLLDLRRKALARAFTVSQRSSRD